MNNTTELSDAEFVRAFEACELSNESFHHRDHIRLAWIYLQSYGALEARRRMAAAIRKLEQDGHTVSPLDWLAQGRSVQPVSELARDL